MQKRFSEKRGKTIDFTNSKIKEFEKILDELTSKYGISDFELVSKIRDREYLPLNIFTKKTSPLETVVKFLKENKGYSFKEIGGLLNRSQKNVWQAYKSAVKKYPKPFSPRYSENDVDVALLANRKLSILEAIVSFQKEKGLSFHEIGILLKRNERTVWTVYHRAKKKK